MNDSHATSEESGKPDSSEQSTVRLVIRAEIIREDVSLTAKPQVNKRAVAFGIASVAVLVALSWAGINAFRSDSPSTNSAGERTRDAESRPPASAPSEAAPVVAPQSSPQPATATAGAAPSATTSIDAPSTATKSAASSARNEPDASPTPVNEVLPNASRSALQTIRGTIRVAVRVTIDKQGTVVAATAEDPGPSRYFERISLEASRKWTFTPANTDEPRTALVRFSFTREAATARADAPR